MVIPLQLSDAARFYLYQEWETLRECYLVIFTISTGDGWCITPRNVRVVLNSVAKVKIVKENLQVIVDLCPLPVYVERQLLPLIDKLIIEYRHGIFIQ